MISSLSHSLSLSLSQDMQDPETMAEVRKMMEDPAFRESAVKDLLKGSTPRLWHKMINLFFLTFFQRLRWPVTRI
jgi:hypothetical protein